MKNKDILKLSAFVIMGIIIWVSIGRFPYFYAGTMVVIFLLFKE